MGCRRFITTPAVLAMLGVMVAAVPAQATIFDKGHFSFQDSVEENLCGIAVRHDITASGHFRDRTGKGDLDQAFFSQVTLQVTGASFSIESNIIDKDVKATPLGGNVFEFRFQEAGRNVVRDMDGNVVLQDTGVFRTTIVFDTLGDSMPGGVVLDETVDRVSGPHPLFEMDEAAFCDMVHDLIG